jgi:hypothetical protein
MHGETVKFTVPTFIGDVVQVIRIYRTSVVSKECVPLTMLGAAKCIQNMTAFWSGLPVLATKMLLLIYSVKACVTCFMDECQDSDI